MSAKGTNLILLNIDSSTQLMEGCFAVHMKVTSNDAEYVFLRISEILLSNTVQSSSCVFFCLW